VSGHTVSGHTVANWGLQHEVDSLDATIVVRGRREITEPGRARGKAFLSAVHNETQTRETETLKIGALNAQIQ
jgi:hypothetical protein